MLRIVRYSHLTAAESAVGAIGKFVSVPSVQCELGGACHRHRCVRLANFESSALLSACVRRASRSGQHHCGSRWSLAG